MEYKTTGYMEIKVSNEMREALLNVMTSEELEELEPSAEVINLAEFRARKNAR